jgi:hypothetical protein
MPHRTTQVVVFVDTLRHPVEARTDGTDRKIIVFQPGQRYLAITGQSPPSEFDRSNSRFRAISRDPDVFPDPNAFKPDRWLDTEGHVRDDLKFFVFGFGRR